MFHGPVKMTAMWQQHKLWYVSLTPVTADLTLPVASCVTRRCKLKTWRLFRERKNKQTWTTWYFRICQFTIMEECPWQIHRVLCQLEQPFPFDLVADMKHKYVSPLCIQFTACFSGMFEIATCLGSVWVCTSPTVENYNERKRVRHFDQPWHSRKISQGSFCIRATSAVNYDMATPRI